MKLALLTSDQPNQVALASKLEARYPDLVIVVSRNITGVRHGPVERVRRTINRVAGRTVGRRFWLAWAGMQGRYADTYGRSFPRDTAVHVDNVNDEATLDALRSEEIALALVSGTNLVRDPIIEYMHARRGIINLHTGISPYVKGGPNCTNWCLAEGWFHLIGSTVMWLDPGIDSGDIIATERAQLDGNESLEGLHWRVMEHAHDLYLRSAEAIATGASVPRVPQATISDGRTFRSLEWGPYAMLRAGRNFSRGYPAAFTDGAGDPPRLVSLPAG